MKKALPKSFQILLGTAMRFSCKAVLADRAKRDGSYALYIQAIINRKKAKVNLGITVKGADFDRDRGSLKTNAPNVELVNFQIAEATMKANKIYLDYRYADRYLAAERFRQEFTDPEATGNFTAFMEKEIELRKPKLSKETSGSNVTIFNKLKSFKNKILFHELTVEFLQKFQNYLKNGVKSSIFCRKYCHSCSCKSATRKKTAYASIETASAIFKAAPSRIEIIPKL